MTKFKVGDRVQNISDNTIPKDECGTIVAIDDNIGVEWDEFDNGHNFCWHDGICIKKPNHGWWVEAEDIKSVCVPEISIKIEKDSPYETCQSLISALETQGVGITFKNDSTLKFAKENKKLKFTFYFNVNEGTRVDKSCNSTIPTITTTVVLDKFGDPDRRKCYSLEGEATCDKADYDMRQGVLEALANAVFDGNFEKAYDKAVKTNAFCERQDRTCHYCGRVFDTVEEKQEHEAWHVERKKSRRERYLLRKRAKEIAFEEQAQKMAKDMLKAKEKSNE